MERILNSINFFNDFQYIFHSQICPGKVKTIFDLYKGIQSMFKPFHNFAQI